MTIKLVPPKDGASTVETSDFIHYDAPYDFMPSASTRLSAIGPPWSQLTADDLNTGAIKWQIPNGGIGALEEQGHNGTGAHFPRGGVVATAVPRAVVQAEQSIRALRAASHRESTR
jgi:hypothetical protein